MSRKEAWEWYLLCLERFVASRDTTETDEAIGSALQVNDAFKMWKDACTREEYDPTPALLRNKD